MNFTLHQLRIFLHVAQYQSITKAAEAMFLTQPAVSIQLKKLQNQFEIPLTEVIGRQLYITEFGEQIAEVSQRILEEADTIRSTVEQFKGLLSGRITFSVVSTGKYVMPYFLNGFVKKYPQVELMMDVTNKMRVVETLEQNQTDFALVSVLPEHLQLESTSLMENHLYLVGSKEESEKLPQRKLKPADLSGRPLIFREQGSATRKAMDGFLREHQIPVTRTLGLVSNEAVKQAVNAGLGFSIMPLIGLRNELQKGEMRMIPMEGLPIITTWRLVHLKGKRLSPVAEAFKAFMEAQKEELIKKHFSWTQDFIK
jgi:DNA-binding transcriptional LysR family regulator